MARKKKRRSRGRRSKKGGVKQVPKTLGGVWRAQPLLVKGGMAITGFDILTKVPPTGGESPVAYLFNPAVTMQQKVNLIPAKLGSNAMNLTNYKPLAYGVIGHYVAKKMKVKGL